MSTNTLKDHPHTTHAQQHTTRKHTHPYTPLTTRHTAHVHQATYTALICVVCFRVMCGVVISCGVLCVQSMTVRAQTLCTPPTREQQQHTRTHTHSGCGVLLCVFVVYVCVCVVYVCVYGVSVSCVYSMCCDCVCVSRVKVEKTDHSYLSIPPFLCF